MLLASGLLFLFASALAAPKCGHLGSQFFNRRRRAIIGGQEIYAQDAPWVVRIDTPRGFECTGTLISDRHVITAAHCFAADHCKSEFKPDLDYSVCYKEDTNDRECDKTRKYRIKEVLLLDRYLNSKCNRHLDIVIAQLDRPILSGTRICMPNEETELYYKKHNNSEAHLLGYSANYDFERAPGNTNKRLKHAATKVNLLRREGAPTLVSAYDKKAALCGGDSGGPMFEIHDQKAILIGVNRGTFGGECKIDEIKIDSSYAEQRTVELKQHLDLIVNVLRKRGIDIYL